MTHRVQPAFAARHIGPTREARARMLGRRRIRQSRGPRRRRPPEPHPRWTASPSRPAASEVAGSSSSLRRIASQNTLVTSMIGLGTTAPTRLGHPARHPREPVVVHGVRPTSRRSPRAGSRRCSTSRRWSPTSPAFRGRCRRCSTSRPTAAEAMTWLRRARPGATRGLRRRGARLPADPRRAGHGPARSASRSSPTWLPPEDHSPRVAARSTASPAPGDARSATCVRSPLLRTRPAP